MVLREELLAETNLRFGGVISRWGNTVERERHMPFSSGREIDGAFRRSRPRTRYPADGTAHADPYHDRVPLVPPMARLPIAVLHHAWHAL